MSCTFGFPITVSDCYGCIHNRYPVRDDPACNECYKLHVDQRPINYKAEEYTFTTITPTLEEWRGDTDRTEARNEKKMAGGQ